MQLAEIPKSKYLWNYFLKAYGTGLTLLGKNITNFDNFNCTVILN